MEITIKQVHNKIYYTNGTKTIYYGTDTLKRFKMIKQLYKEDKLIAESWLNIKFPFRIVFQIKLTETKQIVSLKFKDFFKPKFICSFNGDSYEIIPHKGRKTSIFKNSSQIGFYTEKTLEYFNQETIHLIANEDINKDLIFAFILALKYKYNHDNSTFTINLGNFGPEARKFNDLWKPSIKSS